MDAWLAFPVLVCYDNNTATGTESEQGGHPMFELRELTLLSVFVRILTAIILGGAI